MSDVSDMESNDIAKKKRTLSLAEKKEIIEQIQSGKSIKDVQATYKVGESSIYRFLKNKKDIFAAINSGSKSKKKTLHRPKEEILDKRLYAWCVKKLSEHMPLSGPIIIAKAKSLKQEMNITKDIKFSQGWLRGFKERHGIRQLGVVGKKGSANVQGASRFCETFEEMVTKYKLIPELIYNADETGLQWRCLPKKTLAGNEEKCAAVVKNNKERITVLTCANASGSHKMKILAIGKSARPKALKGVQQLPVLYKSQKNAWMNRHIFRDWFFSDFVPSVRKRISKMKEPEKQKCVLLLDNCSAHPDETQIVSDCGTIFCCNFPLNVTSLIQPMDQGVIQNLKTFYKHDFMMKMVNSGLDHLEFQRGYTIKDALFSLATAWDNVKQSTLSNAWKKLLPQRETADVTPVSHAEKILNLTEKSSPSLELTMKDVNEWIEEKGDCVEIIECIGSPNNDDSDDSNSSSTIAEGTASLDQAEFHMDQVINILEKTPGFNVDDTMLAHSLKNSIITHKLHKSEIHHIRNELKKGIESSVENYRETC